jgi:hypothetical protein
MRSSLIPIRVFKNGSACGAGPVQPVNEPLYSSLWNADNWATGGREKADWICAPSRGKLTYPIFTLKVITYHIYDWWSIIQHG